MIFYWIQRPYYGIHLSYYGIRMSYYGIRMSCYGIQMPSHGIQRSSGVGAKSGVTVRRFDGLGEYLIRRFMVWRAPPSTLCGGVNRHCVWRLFSL